MKPEYNIGVRSGLLEQKHFDSLGPAIWLYLWFINKQPKNTNKVLGGQPVTYKMFADNFSKISHRTYVRWLSVIEAGGYISLLRTPRGFVVTINKSKKWVAGDTPNLASQKNSDTPKIVSDTPNVASAEDTPNVASAIKNYSLDIQKTTNTIVKPATPTTRPQTQKELFNQLVQELGFSEQVKATPARLVKLRARLKTYAPGDLLKVAAVIASDPFMQGDNNHGKRYGTIDYMLRSDEKIDEWLHTRGNKLKSVKADW